MHWEKCKRDTKCVDCSKQMVAGDHRLKVVQYNKVYDPKMKIVRTWSKIEYRCRSCGTAYIDDGNNYKYRPINRMPRGFLPRRIEVGEW